MRELVTDVLNCEISGLNPIRETGGVMREFEEFNLVGQSPAFLCALAPIKKLSCCDATVLIQGETGTGKELWHARYTISVFAEADRLFP